MKLIPILCCALLLSACQSAPSQPVVPAPSAPSSAELVEQVNDASNKRFDGVEQRITLLQEKLIELNLRLEQMLKQEQQQLRSLQGLQQSQSLQAEQAARQAAGPSALDQLTELVFRLEQMSAEGQSQADAQSASENQDGQPSYQLVSAYSSKGWVVLKLDNLSGATWKADGGNWKTIEEVGTLPDSNYQVVMQAAPGDVKGYVAARIDRNNGIAWWLKDNQWEPF